MYKYIHVPNKNLFIYYFTSFHKKIRIDYFINLLLIFFSSLFFCNSNTLTIKYDYNRFLFPPFTSTEFYF